MIASPGGLAIGGYRGVNAIIIVDHFSPFRY